MRLVVLYGSQTGTAQDVAEQIWRESKSWGFSGPVLSLDDYPIEQLIVEKLAVFVIATTGNGDEPDNMKKTWKFLLRRNLSNESLMCLNFACLGLGDSSYAKYNYAAKKFNKRLKQLGAAEMLSMGMCDDQHDYGLSAVSLPWIEQLNAKLRSLFPNAQQNVQNKVVFARNILKWSIKIENETEQLKNLNSKFCQILPNSETFNLIKNQRVTHKAHFQNVRLISMKCPDGVLWNPGDVLDVRPCNSTKQVQEFFELVKEHKMNFTADTVVHLKPLYEDLVLPPAYQQPVTVGWVVTHVWDLNYKPRQRAFELLAVNCIDVLEKEKLEELTTAEGLEGLIQYINRPKRTMLEVLQDFKHATSKLTLQLLFEIFSTIQPRSFSIASIPNSDTLDLLIAVVNYKTKLSVPRLGLCSNWLNSLRENTIISGTIKPGTFILPKNVEVPLILIGPGTGIAPFRSFIQAKEKERQDGMNVGPIIVFFGCRNKVKDYYFSEEFAKWESSKLIELFVAFSRDQNDKVYVQHLIKEQKQRIRELIIFHNAYIFVAGSSNTMPKQVKDAFIDIVDGDDKYVEGMIKCKRYQEETWS